MNIKRISGVLLTLVGIASFLYVAQVLYTTQECDIKCMIIYGGLGVFFFITGTSLMLAKNVS